MAVIHKKEKEEKPAKHAGGRPSEYGPEALKKARAYVDGGWKLKGHVVPYIEGVALALGISRDCVYDWSKDPKKQEFCDIISKLKAEQAMLTLNGAFAGQLNPMIAKLLLSSKHGYAEKTETDVKSDGKELKPGTIVINNPGPPREET